MKFKKTLKEDFTSNDLHKILEDYIYDRLEAAIDNLAILASNDIEEYDADYCSDNVNPRAVAHLSRASEALADELLRYAPAIIHESLEEAYQDKLYRRAQGIADDISEFLDETSRIEDLSDYLDEDDLDHLGKSMDALYYFAHSYSYNESLTEDVNDFYKDEASVEFDDTAFVGKPLKDFLRTIDHRTKINISSDDGYDAIGGKGDTAGMSGLAHDAGWYLADKIVKGIKVPEDKRFYEYSIFIEGFNQEEE